jgi:hypothetical protein
VANFSATGLAATGSYTVTLDGNLTARDLTYLGGDDGSTLEIAVGSGNIITTEIGQMKVSILPGTTLVVAPAIVGGQAPGIAGNGLAPAISGTGLVLLGGALWS